MTALTPASSSTSLCSSVKRQHSPPTQPNTPHKKLYTGSSMTDLLHTTHLTGDEVTQGGEDSEEEVVVARKDKGKGKMKMVYLPELPEEVWTRIFEIYYEDDTTQWQNTGVLKAGLTPVLLSRDHARMALPVLYRHPYVGYKAIKPFLTSIHLPATYTELPYRVYIKHLTIRPSPIMPSKETSASLHKVEGDTSNTSSRPDPYTIHASFLTLMRAVPQLTTFTLKDTLILCQTDADRLFIGLAAINPKKAKLEFRMWDLYKSPCGQDIIGATRGGAHTSHGLKRGNENGPSRGGSPTTDNTSAASGIWSLQRAWRDAMYKGRDYDLPLSWIEPARPEQNNPTVQPTMQVTHWLPTQPQISLASHHGMMPNQLNVQPMPPPHPAPNQPSTPSAFAHISAAHTSTRQTSERSDLISSLDAYRSRRPPRSTNLAPTWSGENESVNDSMRVQDNASGSSNSAPSSLSPPENGSLDIDSDDEDDDEDYTTWLSRQGQLRASSTSGQSPGQSSREVFPAVTATAALQGASSRPVDNAGNMQNPSFNDVTRTPAASSSVLAAAIPQPSRIVPVPASRFAPLTSSHSNDSQSPVGFSGRLRRNVSAGMFTITMSANNNHGPGHYVRGLLQRLIVESWSPDLQALSIVALDPVATLAVRSPILDFWTQISVPHIRVHLPRSIDPLSIFKDAKQVARDRAKRRRSQGGEISNHPITTANANGLIITLPPGSDQAQDIVDDERVVGGDGPANELIHENVRLFEIEINSIEEMRDEVWIRNGDQLPPQLCRILAGDHDWRDVSFGESNDTYSPPYSEYVPADSPATSDFDSPTFSFVSMDNDDVSEQWIENQDDIGHDTYDRSKAEEQARRIEGRALDKEK
ncbi:uncharacterized protein I303_101290 [Kwoniella dejecticola CBS 10117]|uniref:Uncharacterized protein n=1 Tax=Kwoniella dejecticola CBS 10117 TaxID=1296121 RepID=A0AAJ8MDX2_9TREE